MFTNKLEKLNNSVIKMVSKLDKIILKKNRELVKLKKQIMYLKKGEYDSLEQKLDTEHKSFTRFKQIKNTNVHFDVRNFFQTDKYPTFTGTTEEIVSQTLAYTNKIKVINKTKHGFDIFPFMPYETYQLQKGSENDIQILIANILTASLPYYKVRIGYGVYNNKEIYVAMYYTTKWNALSSYDLTYSFNKKYIY